MKKQHVYLILSAASVVLAYGKPVEIRGYLSVVLWLLPVVFMIVQAHDIKKIRVAFIAVLVCYFISSGLFFLRNHGGVTLAHIETDKEAGGHTRVEYCDIDPGAMGSVRCRRTEYYSILESKPLSVRIPKSVKLFNGRYRDLGG